MEIGLMPLSDFSNEELDAAIDDAVQFRDWDYYMLLCEEESARLGVPHDD